MDVVNISLCPQEHLTMGGRGRLFDIIYIYIYRAYIYISWGQISPPLSSSFFRKGRASVDDRSPPDEGRTTVCLVVTSPRPSPAVKTFLVFHAASAEMAKKKNALSSCVQCCNRL